LTLAISVSALLGILGAGAIPSASAQTCVITVTLLTGKQVSFTVNVAPGTPVSSIPLPVKGPFRSISESCTQTSTTTHTTTTHTTTSTQTTTTTTSSHTTKPGGGNGNSGGGGGNKKHNHQPQGKGHGGGKGGSGGSGSGGGSGGGSSKHKSPSKPPPAKGKGGVPTSTNPTFSFSLPGAPPVGVPNFFIDSFRIPPFLLPIYQAAGIEYDVPWQILAAINEIETDYGRNLSVSSAGAVGWMQFMPSTWKTWGVDANGDGVADPYNPVDAIFSAARYLHAAGASKSVNQAIFAYNHASWYVQSVLLRAKLIGGMPSQLIGALTGLVEGHFPVAAPSKYADQAVTKLAKKRVKGTNAAVPVNSTGAKSVQIFAKQKAPVIAVNDGKIVKIGETSSLGHYLQLQDSTGNIYTYAHLGSIPKLYPVPKPVKISAAELTQELSTPALPKPTAPASGGQQQAASTTSTAKATSALKKSAPISLPVAATTPAASQAPTTPVVVKERLFADPTRPASYAAGGALQIKNNAAEISSFRNYFSDVLHLGKNQYTLQPLKAGSIVVAGTILGRIGAGSSNLASHLTFMIQPAGKKAPDIDPKPILDGWKLLEATAVYRASGVDPFYGPGAKNATVGQILLMSKEQLTNRVLVDPHVHVYSCGRRDIQAGLIDRRVLATIEFLSASGLDPTVDGLRCGSTVFASTGSSANSGESVAFSKINNIPIAHHQGAGSITDITIRRLLTLQGAMRPDQIISDMSYKGQSNTLALADHSSEIQVSFTPLFGGNKKLSSQVGSILKPGQWTALINHISQIPEPVVPIAPSRYSVRATTH
jgi:hypothetical protein